MANVEASFDRAEWREPALSLLRIGGGERPLPEGAHVTGLVLGSAEAPLGLRGRLMEKADWQLWPMVLHSEDIGHVDALAIHAPEHLAATMAGFDLARFWPRLVQVLGAGFTPEQLDTAAAWLGGLGYRVNRQPSGLVAEVGSPQRPDMPGMPLLRQQTVPHRHDNEAWHRLIEAGMAQGRVAEALGDLRAWQMAIVTLPPEASAWIEAGLAAFRAHHAKADLAAAEPVIAALAGLLPHHAGVLRAALVCNVALGWKARAQRFARALLPLAPDEHLVHLSLVEAHAAAGDHAAEENSRRHLALSAPGTLHPLRKLHEAHRALSLMLLRGEDSASMAHAAQLVAMARETDAESLDDPALRHWLLHYRSLVEAADPALLQGAPPEEASLALCGSDGRALTWSQLRRRAAWRDAALVFLVAADERYLRLYGRAYLESVLRETDVPAIVVVHVIGGQDRLAALAAATGLRDHRLIYTADGFDPLAVTTRCHDSDGPRALPVAHFQSVRFAMAARLLAATGRPVIVSDIDVVLQRGVADLLAYHARDDVVLNRNAGSDSFGSHVTANLALFRPSAQGLAYARDLSAYLAGALARNDVSRWIDQCGLQLVWCRHAGAGVTRFGWFDTASDINNVIYPHWMPNPFRFLSLFHGFDMASLPGHSRAA